MVTLHGRCIWVGVVVCAVVTAMRVTLEHQLSVECRGTPLHVNRPVEEVRRCGLLVDRGNVEPQVARAHIAGPGCLHRGERDRGPDGQVGE